MEDPRSKVTARCEGAYHVERGGKKKEKAFFCYVLNVFLYVLNSFKRFILNTCFLCIKNN